MSTKSSKYRPICNLFRFCFQIEIHGDFMRKYKFMGFLTKKSNTYYIIIFLKFLNLFFTDVVFFLQELLLADQSEISFIVFPDISAPTMANVLDYIYTGSVILHSSTLPDFISVANLLKLRVEDSRHEPKIPEQNGVNYNYNYEKYPNYENRFKTNLEYKNPICGPECFKSYPFNNNEEQVCDFKLQEKRLKFSPIILQDERNPNLTNGNRIPENKLPYFKQKEVYAEHDIENYKKDYPFENGFQNLPPMKSQEINGNLIEEGMNGVKKKTIRKIPNLMPISRFTAFKAKKGLYNRVFPSPWSQRISPLVADPRNEYLREKSVPPVSIFLSLHSSYYKQKLLLVKVTINTF